jgi:hypothetical protein
LPKIFVNIVLFFITIFAFSCANIVTPTGGPKDVKPPTVMGSEPANRGVNFSSRTITINFDEFIALSKDAYKQVIVSPYMKEPPDLKLRGKSLIVHFIDSLRENTTYTISFGNAIIDITEGNALSNYTYSFSTGSAFDSLTIEGAVVNAYTLKPESNVYVMLYTSLYDSVPYKITPYYLALTDASGNFRLQNLQNNSYKVFALKDVDANMLFSQPNEDIAFIDTLVKPETPDTTKIDSLKKNTKFKMFLFKEQPTVQKLLKSNANAFGKTVFVFRLPVSDLKIRSLKNDFSSSDYLAEYSKNKDTITLWLKNYEKDSLILELKDGNFPPDTASLSLMKKSSDKARGKHDDNPKTVKLSTNTLSGSLAFFRTFTILASAPIKKQDFSKIFLINEKDTMTPEFRFTDSIHRNLSVINKWKEDASYKLVVLPGALTDIFGNPNDTLEQTFKTTKTENYGNIEIKLSTGIQNCSYLVQLLNDKDALIAQQSTIESSTLLFKFVPPGTYKVRVICDANNNGEWDTGSYLKKTQPEKVFYYPSTLSVRANWDQQIEWSISK